MFKDKISKLNKTAFSSEQDFKGTAYHLQALIDKKDRRGC
jgi:hypothetical protein